MNLLGVAQLKGIWKQQLGSAKSAWGRLLHDERLISQGRAQRLAGLLQARYAFSRVDADAQVQSFIAKHKD
ncbi:CsbD family protein [Pseudomonas leptonychotis]|uniref:CsbD family protein n=1 Tax=Pseudomonas leptonychotis TaxID=2448482 RepID=UPI003863296C